MRISDWSSDVCSSDLQSVGLTVVFRQSVGEPGLSVAQRVAGQYPSFDPPLPGVREVGRNVRQQRDGRFVERLAPAQAQPLVEQAGVGGEVLRSARDRAVNARWHLATGAHHRGEALLGTELDRATWKDRGQQWMLSTGG